MKAFVYKKGVPSTRVALYNNVVCVAEEPRSDKIIIACDEGGESWVPHEYNTRLYKTRIYQN